jgi:hypothetical protein
MRTSFHETLLSEQVDGSDHGRILLPSVPLYRLQLSLLSAQRCRSLIPFLSHILWGWPEARLPGAARQHTGRFKERSKYHQRLPFYATFDTFSVKAPGYREQSPSSLAV